MLQGFPFQNFCVYCISRQCPRCFSMSITNAIRCSMCDVFDYHECSSINIHTVLYIFIIRICSTIKSMMMSLILMNSIRKLRGQRPYILTRNILNNGRTNEWHKSCSLAFPYWKWFQWVTPHKKKWTWYTISVGIWNFVIVHRQVVYHCYFSLKLFWLDYKEYRNYRSTVSIFEKGKNCCILHILW